MKYEFPEADGDNLTQVMSEVKHWAAMKKPYQFKDQRRDFWRHQWQLATAMQALAERELHWLGIEVPVTQKEREG